MTWFSDVFARDWYHTLNQDRKIKLAKLEVIVAELWNCEPQWEPQRAMPLILKAIEAGAFSGDGWLAFRVQAAQSVEPAKLAFSLNLRPPPGRRDLPDNLPNDRALPFVLDALRAFVAQANGLADSFPSLSRLPMPTGDNLLDLRLLRVWAGGQAVAAKQSGATVTTWVAVTDAAKIVQPDHWEDAKSQISRATNEGRIKSNEKKRRERRVDLESVKDWWNQSRKRPESDPSVQQIEERAAEERSKRKGGARVAPWLRRPSGLRENAGNPATFRGLFVAPKYSSENLMKWLPTATAYLPAP